MRAVNLIPADQRRGAGAAGRSGTGVYLLLGSLTVLVVALTAYVLASNSVKSNQEKLVRVTDEAARVEAQATALKPYRDFATLRQKRIETVSLLAASRFDWEQTLRQISRVIPANVWLTDFIGTVAPGIPLEGGSAGDSASLRQKVQAPAVQLVGCTDSQAEVSRIMSRLRRMTGVTRVSLAGSEKPDNVTSGTQAAGNVITDCRTSLRIPRFQIVVFFRPLPGAAGAVPGASGAPAPAPGASAAAPPRQPVSQSSLPGATR